MGMEKPMSDRVTLTKTSMYHTSSERVTVAADSIERMEYDPDFCCTDIYLKSGKSLSVLEHPSRIEELIAVSTPEEL